MVALFLLSLPRVGALLLERGHVLRVKLVEIEFVEFGHDSEAGSVEEEVEHLIVLDVLLL